MNGKRVLMAVLLCMVFAPAVWAKTLYVSTSGSDSGTGDQSAPYQTIEKAFTAAKDLKSTNPDVTIEVAKGNYTLTNQILVNKDYPNITLNLEAETKITADTELAATMTKTFNNDRKIEKRLFVINNGNLTVNGQGGAEIDAGSTNSNGCFMVIENSVLTISNVSLKYSTTTDDTAGIHLIGGKASVNNVNIETTGGCGLVAENFNPIASGAETVFAYAEVNNCQFTCNKTTDTGNHWNVCIVAGTNNSHVVVRGGKYTAKICTALIKNKGGIIDIYDGEFTKTVKNYNGSATYGVIESDAPNDSGNTSDLNVYGGKFAGDIVVGVNQTGNASEQGTNILDIYGGQYQYKVGETYSPYFKFGNSIVYEDTQDTTYKYKFLYFEPSLDNNFGIKNEVYNGKLTLKPISSPDRKIDITNIKATLSTGEAVTVNSDGTFSFTPTEAKDYILNISADLTDSGFPAAQGNSVNARGVVIIPVGSVANVKVDNTAANSGTAYEGILSADVATPTDWVKAAAFKLGTVTPAWDGLKIENGKLTGTAPVVMKTTTYTVPITAEAEVLTTIGEKATFAKTENLTITVEPSNVTVTPSITTLPDGTANQEYSANITFTVTPSGLEQTISVEGLPSGLAFSDGKITGTPTESGTFTVKFNVTVTDSSGGTATQTVTLSLVINAVASGGGVIIDDNGGMTVSETETTNFSDLIASLSADNKLDSITSVTINDTSSLTTIQGLDKLTSLKSLDVVGNNTVTNVDLSSSESLTNVNLQNCSSLTEVKAENCTNLQKLDCSGGSVEKISLQGCDSLTDLSCQNNNLEELDVSECPNLTSLDCSANNIGSLNVEGCENLTSLNCGANSLSDLSSITSCRRLEVLYCYSNNLTELNVQNSERLYILVCDDNSLNTLNVEQNKKLKRLDCQNNAMPALDITSAVFQKLQRLKCYGQSLTGLTLSQSGGQYNFNLMSYMQSGEFAAAAVDVNNSNDDLNNFKSSSSVDNVSGIKAYDADGNAIEVTSYESGVISFASKPSKIVYDYDTGYNNTMMDVTISEKTQRSGGSTTETVTSGGGGSSGGCDAGFGVISALIILAVVLSIKGMKNKIFFLILIFIPMSSAVASADVEINSANFPDANFRNYVLASADTDGDGTLTDAEIAAVTYIDVNTMDISNLKGIENFVELIELFCYANNLAALDVSSNKKLQILECDKNKLTSLNLSQNSALAEFECELNCIRTLDLSSNTELYYVKCYNQMISDVDVTSSDKIFYVDLGDYVGTENLAKIVSSEITGENSSGDVINSVSYNATSGVVGFSEYPYEVTYKYETGYYESANKEMTMDVTLITSGDVSAVEKVVKSSGGGGGSSSCDATGGTKGLIFAAFMIIINFYLRKCKVR